MLDVTPCNIEQVDHKVVLTNIEAGQPKHEVSFGTALHIKLHSMLTQ